MDAVTIATGGKWLWDPFAPTLTSKARGRAQQAWKAFRWRDAERAYRQTLREQLGTVRLADFRAGSEILI